MFRKRLTLGVAALVVVSLALVGCGAAKTDADKGSNGASGANVSEKVLKVGSDLTYAPLEFQDKDGKAQGFDIDLIKAIGEDMGYKVEIESSSWEGLVPSLDAGKYDVVISAMTITPDRAKSVLFSDKYFLSTQLVAVSEGSNIQSQKDLEGKKMGVQMGTTAQTVLENMGIDPGKYKTNPDAINDLLNGGLDAVMADSPIIKYFIAQNPDKKLVTVAGDYEKEYYGMAFKLGNTELANKVNASLKKLMENGKYTEIYKKWFNEEPPTLN